MNPPDLRNPIHLLAFGFGSGLARHAPGTWGSLAALALWWPLAQLPVLLYVALVVAAAVGGIYLCGRTARDMGVHDHGGIVWDEFVGVWLALSTAPLQWPWLLCGFALFRLLDIWKPWPISWFDRELPGGLGIMADDVVAGLLVALALALAQLWI
jgi:phosphatidylglycerophosphatase A